MCTYIRLCGLVVVTCQADGASRVEITLTIAKKIGQTGVGVAVHGQNKATSRFFVAVVIIIG